ncbi:MAG: hypothetical protein K6C09_08325 [Oscillospiraceae bacterium]|nr:hypothetical protein [Oscillospiraceae bacterium]
MAEETVNQETEHTAEQNQPDRTFTQSEVDAIISDRLKREREKFADYADLKTKAGQFDELTAAHGEAQKENESLKAKVAALQKDIDARNIREKISAETGVPANLLNGDTEEVCKKQAEMILAWRGPQPKYPDLGDGGEVPPHGGGSTRQQFASWYEQNIKK